MPGLVREVVVMQETMTLTLSYRGKEEYSVPVSWKGPLSDCSVRDMREIAGVLADPDCFVTGPAYYMYRDITRSDADRQWLQAQKIRYDITVIPPRNLSGEFIKTKGHYHPKNPAGTGYPEIYEVLEGEAHYLLQKRDCSGVVMVTATAGDVVVVPPGYGHITINPSKTSVLQMANLVSSVFQSEYQEYENLRGAIFYEMTNRTCKKNPLYPQNPALTFTSADRMTAVKEMIPAPLYTLVEQRAPVLGFLNHPEDYPHLFS